MHRLALAALLLLVPSLARAHAILMESDPPVGGAVAPGATTLRLEYNSRIDQDRSRVTLSHQNSPDERLKLLPSQKPDILQANATLAPGDYVLHWFVLATDGHITRGDVPFTVKAGAKATGQGAE